jgi:hypothetical protein
LGHPLSDGRFGCGRVLYVLGPSDPQPSLYLNTRLFLAGLMDWSVDEPPTTQALAGSKLLDQVLVHMAAITGTGCKILGQRDLEKNSLSALIQVSHRGGGTVWLLRRRKTPARRNEPKAPDLARHVSVGSASHRAACRETPGTPPGMIPVHQNQPHLMGSASGPAVV